MSPRDLEPLLPLSGIEPGRTLPREFSACVLRQGRRLKALTRLHWRWLAGGSLVALILSTLIALALVRLVPEKSSTPPEFGVLSGFSPVASR